MFVYCLTCGNVPAMALRKLPGKRGGAAMVEGATPSVHEPAANTAAVITLAAEAGRRHVVRYLAWSYSAAPTGGRLTVTDGGTNKLVVDITAAGQGSLNLTNGFQGAVNSAVVATLAAGGAAVTGKLSLGSSLT